MLKTKSHEVIFMTLLNFKNMNLTQINESASNIHPLITKRELEVLEEMSKGLTSKEIAQKMFVSNHTIISHKKNLVQKLNARNAVDLMVKAIRKGLISI